MCEHTVSNLQQPFALVALDSGNRMEYRCCSCAADFIEAELEQGASVYSFAAKMTFARCEHKPGSGSDATCWVCLSAIRAELTLRWSRAFFRNKPHANRLQRTSNEIGKVHGPTSTPVTTSAPVPTIKPTWQPAQPRYPGEWKRDERIRKERRKVRVRTKLQPVTEKPAIMSSIPVRPVAVSAPVS